MIPDVWERKSLVSLTLHLGRGKSPNYFESDTTIFAINQKCIRNGTVNPTMARGHNPDIPIKSEVLLEDGDICVNSTGNGTIGRVGLWKTPVNNKYRYFADTHVTVVRPARDLVYPKFLAETLQSCDIQNSMEMECFTGSTNQVELNKSAFSALQILFPPINVQKKIAVILSSVDDAIQATQGVIDQTRRVKQGLLQQLLTRGIGHTRFKQTEIGEIPEEWENTTIGRVTESHSYGPRFSSKNYSENGNVKTIRGTDLTETGEILYKQVPTAMLDEKIVQQHKLLSSDLVFITTADCGRSAIFVEQKMPYIPSAYAVRYRLKKAISPPYIKLFMQTQSAKTQIDSFIRKGTVANLPGSDVLKIKLPLPPLDEQLKILQIFNSIEFEITQLIEILDSYSKIKNGLMQDLLTGRVRVKLDGEAAI